MNRKIKIAIWIGNWISSWIDIICALLSVITFCYYRPWWDFKFRIYWDKKILRMRIIK